MFHGRYMGGEMVARLKIETRELLSLKQRTWGRELWRILKKVPAKGMSIEEHRFYCHIFAMDIKFPVPKSRASYPVKVLDSTTVEAHAKYRYASEPWLLTNPKKSEKRFKMELESVYLTFPRINHRPTILAMAAWFSVLCKVDDLTERMEANTAKQTLQDARNILGEDWGSGLSADTNWNQNLTPEDMTRHIIREFLVYTRDLLQPATHHIFLEDIGEVVGCMIAETEFRETPPPSLDAYMKIRSGTIAISPFFILADGCLNKLSVRPPPSKELAELKELVNRIVGLQNDLIGVEKDIQNGWSMNVVVVLGRLQLRSPISPEEEIQIMKECVKEAESMYGDAVRKAIECWEVIQGGSNKRYDKDLSNVMIEFIGTFLKWSMASQRYKSG